MLIGLRVDVDTYRGTRYGVPNLCRVLADHALSASFFFSVGPDNMGRHLWRLLRPAFLKKMIRTRAASLYGLDILLRGTLWPGPVIGKQLGHIIRSTAEAGHEVGLHAWDHHAWQVGIDRMSGEAIRESLGRGVRMLAEILGRPPRCSAAPAWKCNELVLVEKNRFPFVYNSDCRGRSIFLPVVRGEELSQPQIPVTLPTYDEVIGRGGIADNNYNDHILSLAAPRQLNVLTVHAEVEGISRLLLFEGFVRMVRERGASLVPLHTLLADGAQPGKGKIGRRQIPGREGWLSWQVEAGSGGRQSG